MHVVSFGMSAGADAEDQKHAASLGISPVADRDGIFVALLIRALKGPATFIPPLPRPISESRLISAGKRHVFLSSETCNWGPDKRRSCRVEDPEAGPLLTAQRNRGLFLPRRPFLSGRA